MARGSLKQRVAKAFPSGQTDEFTLLYLSAILEARRDSESSARRTGLLVVAVIVAIELLLAHRVDEISLLGTTISDVAVMRSLAPAILAYLTYELFHLVALTVAWADLKDELLARLRPALVETDLNDALRPGVANLWGGPTWHIADEAGIVTRVRETLDVAIAIAHVLGVWVYICSVYLRLFETEGGAAAVWLSTAFALLMVFRTALLVADETRRPELANRG